MSRPFCVHVDRRERVAILRIEGELDMATTEDFATEIRAATVDSSLVVIDFAALTFIDCNALRALERSIQAARDDHVQLEVAALPDKVARIVELAEVKLPLIDRPPF